ncbi:1097_t:CDS:2 [Acaulospora colombiana]|uniref:1097_t:CDS:1 n=1 Tax=Acaulospora colombiana TaxID=27376 RepID=A0ACA9JVG1_9GLOM|nr:1097_t:CDS:2 [Acaulospora colombiana]
MRINVLGQMSYTAPLINAKHFYVLVGSIIFVNFSGPVNLVLSTSPTLKEEVSPLEKYIPITGSFKLPCLTKVENGLFL